MSKFIEIVVCGLFERRSVSVVNVDHIIRIKPIDSHLAYLFLVGRKKPLKIDLSEFYPSAFRGFVDKIKMNCFEKVKLIR